MATLFLAWAMQEIGFITHYKDKLVKMSLIEVKHVIKTYQMGDEKFHALNDVSFSIKKGDDITIFTIFARCIKWLMHFA